MGSCNNGLSSYLALKKKKKKEIDSCFPVLSAHLLSQDRPFSLKANTWFSKCCLGFLFLLIIVLILFLSLENIFRVDFKFTLLQKMRALNFEG